MNKEESGFNKIRKMLTPEKIEEIKQKRLAEKASLSLAYQLGLYVGNNIVNEFLPTLSVDDIKTRTNIAVTPEETAEYQRLNDSWFEKCSSHKGDDISRHNASEKQWKELVAYSKKLQDKYLPKTVDCHMRGLHITAENIEDFKKGISSSLWDSDCSHYSTSIKNIEVKDDEDGWFTIITLKKSV